ncbi:hypothetical protein Q3G72_012121 [Acer saccharum]|nr:hypothetical protein Q3G72_012121 [Acer saccharum]
MAFCAILRKSASYLALTANRHAGANRNYFSTVITASSGHLNRKSTLGSFVPDFDFSSATETKKCSSINESLLQAIDSKIKCADDHDHVEETPNEFTMKIGDSNDPTFIVLTKEYQDEIVEVLSPADDYREKPVMGRYTTVFLGVNISKGGLSLEFECHCTSDAILIQRIVILSSVNSKHWTKLYPGDDDNFDDDNFVQIDELDANLREAFSKYLETRGIKPSILDLFYRCYSNKKLVGWKKIKNFIQQLS